jgi:hypothetical protein
MKILRKLKTFGAIIAGCSNWREITLIKLGLSSKPVKEIRLRNGLTIGLDRDVRADWGEVFEPAIAGVHGTAASDADLFIDVGANLGGFNCLAAYTVVFDEQYLFAESPAEPAPISHR